MKNYVAYFLLLALVVGLPAAVIAMPWNIEWAYWLQPKVMIGTAGWIVVAYALSWGTYRLFKWTERGSDTGPLEIKEFQP